MAEDINAPVRKTDSRFDEWLFQFWAKYQSLQRVGRAIAALANGFVVKTGDETFTSRTITGTANEITLTNGDGGSGNPTVSIPTNVTFTGKTITGGTYVTPTVSGQLILPSGSASIPSFSFTGETNLDTGIYRSAENTLGFTSAGTLRGTISDSNVVFNLPTEISGGVLTVTGGQSSSLSTLNVTGANTFNGNVVCGRFNSNLTGAASTSSVTCLDLTHTVSSPNNLSIDYGILDLKAHNSAGNITNSYGTFSRIDIGSLAIGGTIARHTCFEAAAPGINAAATQNMTIWEGIRVGSPTNGAGGATISQVFGLRGTVSAGTNRWNTYNIGTADNAFQGNVRIGSTVAPTVALDVTGSANISALTSLGGVARTAAALSTTAPAKLYVNPATFTDNTTAASGTVAHGTINSFDNPAIASTNSTVTYTNASTVYIDGAPTNGTNVTITNPYSLFVNTGNTVFGGNNSFGKTTAPTVAVDVAGAILATTSIRSSGQTSGVGYATGAGGTATQGAGSGKATTVTLNRVCGQITMDSATLNAGASVTFTLSNTAIAATDLVHVNIASGATADSYETQVAAVTANSCNIQLRNVSAGNLSEAVVLNFAVIKSVTA
jgi:hypothetical protein